MKRIYLLACLFIIVFNSFSQLKVDPSFNPNDKGGGKHSGTFSQVVYSSIILPDGKVLIGGNYKFIHNTPNQSLSKLNADGTLDNSFKSPVFENAVSVNAMAKQKNGKVILAGSFINFNGPDSRIVRINADGSRDSNFNVNISKITAWNFDDPCSINIQDDQKIIVSDVVLYLNPSYAVRTIVRLNTNGKLDKTFNANIIDPDRSIGDDAIMTCAKLDKQGKLLVIGHFNTSTPSFKDFVRLNTDGSLDTTFKYSGTIFQAQLPTFDIQEDGKIVFSANGDVIRVNTDGSIDNTFLKGFYNIGTLQEVQILSIKIQPDQKILMCGGFLNYSNSNHSKLIRLNQNGDIDETFSTGFGLELYRGPWRGLGTWLPSGPVIKSINLFDDGSIFITGPFSYYNGIWEGDIAKLNADGSLSSSFNIDNGEGADANVNSIVLQNDDKAIIAGYFSYYNGAKKNKIARINTDGSIDNTFNTGTGPDSCSYLNTTAIQKDGKILVGGNFSSFNGKDQSYIIRLNPDGTFDNSFKFEIKKLHGDEAEGVKKILVQPDGKIFIYIISVDHRNNSYYINPQILRLYSDGKIDSLFSEKVANEIWDIYDIPAMALQADGKLIVGGYFKAISNSANYFSLCRLNTDGSVDESFKNEVPETGNNITSKINDILIDSSGQIYIAGGIGEYSGKPVNNFFRINPDGSLDESFHPKNELNENLDAGYSIKFDTDNKLIFTTYRGFICCNADKYFYSKIVRYNSDGSLDSSFGLENKGDFSISDVAIQKDGKILVGGWLESFNDIKRNRIMRLTPPEVLPLQWVKVNAVRTGKSNVTVNWLTANEINVKKFIVLRSLSAQTFAEIATVNAGSHNYSFVDENATLAGKTIYYKIQSTDVDGKISYSNVVSVHIDGKKEIFVSPNPATDHIDIITNLASSKKLNIAITDNNGFLIQKNVIQAADGYTKNSIRLDNLAKGIYYIHISGTGMDEVFKTVIQ